MLRIILILTFASAISSIASKNVDHPYNSGWLFGAQEGSATGQSKGERSLCDTKECIRLAKILKEGMNGNVDPCENFYEYACGNWKNHNPLPKNEETWNLLVKTRRNVQHRITEIVEKEQKPDDLFAVKVAKRMYKACMDTDKIEEIGLEPVISTISRVGGWPLIMEDDEWYEPMYRWQNIDDYYARLIGLNSFHDIRVMKFDKKERNASTLIYIDSPHLPPKAYRFLTTHDIYADSSDENNDSKEGSQEPGSEEERDSEEQEDDDEDDEEIRMKRIAVQRRVNKRLAHRKGKSEVQRRLNKRIKRSTKKTGMHSRKWNKQTKPVSRNVHRVEKHRHPVSTSNVKASARGTMTGDMYFADDNAENESKNNNDKDNEENSDDGNNDDEDNGSVSYENFYDYEEYSEEDDSGSGDWNDDEEDGEENRWGSGDDEEGGDIFENKEANRKAMELRKKYAEYILNVSLAFAEARGVLIPKERLVNDIEDLIEFQILLTRYIFSSGDAIKDIQLQSFQEIYDSFKPTTSNGNINWVKKVQNLFAIGGMDVNGNITTLVEEIGYIKNLCKLLDRTPSRTIVNYIHWNFISRVIMASTAKMQTLYYNWKDEEKPTTNRVDRCIEETQLSHILGYEYVKYHFSDSNTQMVSDMVDDIEKEIEYQIEEADWVNEEIRKFLLEKLVYMKKHIGYPSFLRNKTFIDQYFRGISVSKSHYENQLNVMRYVKWQSLREIYKEDDEYEALLDPLMVNAFFLPSGNRIVITAADFQSPLFDPNQPWYTNFGIMGFIIAHEVNHGFDDNGFMFNKDGDFTGWLTAHNNYTKQAKCFEDQFNKYSVAEGRTANISIENYGSRTLSENIADSMGLQTVYQAYLRRQRECKTPDPMLPGFENFTNEQMFFLSFANMRCENESPEIIKLKLEKDPHSLGPMRVIGSVSNSEDFARTFNCPVNSPMNPKKKCNIWKQE